jgi:hypothetical protein
VHSAGAATFAKPPNCSTLAATDAARLEESPTSSQFPDRACRAAQQQYLVGAGHGLDRGSVLETQLRKQAQPLVGGQERVLRPKIAIGILPPSLGHAEGEIHPALGARALECDEQAPRGQQAGGIGNSAAQVRSGVQDVRRHHHVVLRTVETLVRGVVSDIEKLVLEEGISGQDFAGPVQKQRRDVGENVLRAAGGKQWRDTPRGAAGSGSNFEDAQRAVCRQSGDRVTDGAPHQLIHHAGNGRLGIEPLQGRR